MFLKKINEQEKQKGATKERLSVWQKYFINGEYLRSAEMAEEQNYNMIDGRINNLLPKKENPEVPKKRKSVLLRLYKHRCEVAKKQGKPMPRRYQGMEMELGENIIAEEFQKGYMYRESVVRHSMVKVAN